MMQTYRYKISQKWKQRVSSKLQIKYRVGCPQIYKWKICQKCKGGTWFMKQIQIKLKFQSNTSIKGYMYIELNDELFKPNYDNYVWYRKIIRLWMWKIND